MTHDQPEAPKKGHRLSLLSLIGFWGPEETVRKEQRPLPKPEAQTEGQSHAVLGPRPLPRDPLTSLLPHTQGQDDSTDDIDGGNDPGRQQVCILLQRR